MNTSSTYKNMEILNIKLNLKKTINQNREKQEDGLALKFSSMFVTKEQNLSFVRWNPTFGHLMQIAEYMWWGLWDSIFRSEYKSQSDTSSQMI